MYHAVSSMILEDKSLLQLLLYGDEKFKLEDNQNILKVTIKLLLSFQNSMTLETGLSDFHKMTVTVLKRYFKKKPPITITYRDLKSFDALKFREDIRNQLEPIGELDVDSFKHVFTSTWNLHAPLKKKVVRANNAPFMNKSLSKAFMHRSKLKNKCHKWQ